MSSRALNPPPGSFSQIDTIHAHVDGGGSSAPVEYIVDELRKLGSPGKTTQITRATDGPQRKEDWAFTTYDNHTPGPPGEEERLEFFSTTTLTDRLTDLSSAIFKLRTLLSLLFEQQAGMPPGIVVEVERVVAKGEEDIQWSKTPIDESLIIHSPDVGYLRKRTADIEVHFAFDVPKLGRWREEAPFTVEQLRDACQNRGIYVGGWFSFDDPEKWSYRSNQFATREVDIGKKVQEERNLLNDYVQKQAERFQFQSSVRALVEQVLGVWRTPLALVDQEQRKSRRQLAEWEADRGLQEFWVLAPNFLGDTHSDVRQAMIRNLRDRVKYTYFLRSFADVQRLRKLAETLEPDVRGRADVFELISAVLLESFPEYTRDFFREEYFVADPNSSTREGYRLLRTSPRGQVYEGERMTPKDYSSIESVIRVLEQKHIAHYRQIPLSRDMERPQQQALVCTKLTDTLAGGVRLTGRLWEESRNEFDQLLADTVSKHSGQVAKGSIDSHFLVFDHTAAAVACAVQLKEEIEKYNRIGYRLRIPAVKQVIDFGHIRKLLRSYGFDFSGRPVGICSSLVERADDGEVLITKAAAENLQLEDSRQFKTGNPGNRSLDGYGTIDYFTVEWSIPNQI